MGLDRTLFRARRSAVALTELLVGARDGAAEERIGTLVKHLPVIGFDREVGGLAGRMA